MVGSQGNNNVNAEVSVPDKAKQAPYDFYQNFEEGVDEGDTSDSLPDMEIEVGTVT